MFLYHYHPFQGTIQFSHISLVICKLIFLGSADARCIHLLGTILNAYSMFSTSLFMQIIISPVVRWYLKFYFLPKLIFFSISCYAFTQKHLILWAFNPFFIFCWRSWLYQYLLIVSGAATCLIYIHRWPTFLILHTVLGGSGSTSVFTRSWMSRFASVWSHFTKDGCWHHLTNGSCTTPSLLKLNLTGTTHTGRFHVFAHHIE